MNASPGKPWVALFAAIVAANSGACEDAGCARQVLRGKTMPATACTATLTSRVMSEVTQPTRRPESEPPCPKPAAPKQPVNAFEPNDRAWLFA
jgi:hypothetical protein